MGRQSYLSWQRKLVFTGQVCAYTFPHYFQLFQQDALILWSRSIPAPFTGKNDDFNICCKRIKDLLYRATLQKSCLNMSVSEKRLRFAIVGCGRIAQRHAEHIDRFVNLVAACDIDENKARTLADTYDADPFIDLQHRCFRSRRLVLSLFAARMDCMQNIQSSRFAPTATYCVKNQWRYRPGTAARCSINPF